MNKCLKITLRGDIPKGFLQSFVQKHAKKLSLEGSVQLTNGGEQVVKIIACGSKEDVDAFLDIIYKGSAKADLADIIAEPFLKERDYRGVFRVIE